MLYSFAAPRGNFGAAPRLSRQGKILSAIDEIEAFADSSDEKILLNLSADRLTDSAESIAAALRESMPNVESILIQDRARR